MPVIPSHVRQDAVSSIDHFMHTELIKTLTDGRSLLEPQRDWQVCVATTKRIDTSRLYFSDEQVQIAELMLQANSTNLNAIANFVRHLAALPRPLVRNILSKERRIIEILEEIDAELARTAK